MNRTRCYHLWKQDYNIFLLACMFVRSKDVLLHNYGWFPAVSCNFFNLLNASLCSEDNLAFHTERDSSTLSSHVRCTHILCSWRNLWQLSVASLFIQIISPMIPAYDWDSLWEKPAWRIVGNQPEIHQYIRSNTSEADLTDE